MAASPEHLPGLSTAEAMALSPDAAWVFYDIEQSALSPDLETRLKEFLDASDVDEIVADPRFWVSAITPGKTTAIICVLENRGHILGVLTINIHRMRLSIFLGPFLVRRHPIRRFRIAFSSAVFARGVSAETQTVKLSTMLDELARCMGSDDVLFLEAVSMESPLMMAATIVPHPAFRAVAYGGVQPHWLAYLPKRFDTFMQELGSQTRQSIRRYGRKFTEAVNDDYAVKRFTTLDAVDTFLDDAIRVSEMTWQYKDAMAGIRNRELWNRMLRAAANLGWFRSYILYVADQPVAYILGFQYRCRFHYWMVGYNPAWRELRVGNFLVIEVIRDLIDSGSDLTVFDFGPTDNPLKQRIGNSSASEGYFYLFPRTLHGTCLALVVSTANRLTELVKRTLAKRNQKKGHEVR
jgi:hypothetical protein